MVFGIKFAPLSLPIERRLQTLAVFYFCSEFFLIGQIISIILIYLLFTKFYYITLFYVAWFVYDRNVCFKGGRRSEWMRRWSIWKHFADYFPVKLVKTTDLPSDKNYIFACHPHGVLCFSHFVNFGTEGTNFSEIFPNINPHLITLNYQFYLPFHRELFSQTGACSASAESIQYILSKKGTGNAAALVIGGAREVLDIIPGTMILTLKKRKGFIRLALINGASLVPVISFGENDLYYTINKEEPTLNTKIQEMLIKILSFPLPVFFGRGIFQYSFGWLPFRRPIYTIVGKPIDVPKNLNPTQEEIESLHQKYIEELIKLFEENKSKYSCENVTLKIK